MLLHLCTETLITGILVLIKKKPLRITNTWPDFIFKHMQMYVYVYI